MQNTIQRKGFTIVELLIVIVVVGILAAISIVAYNGIQRRAQDVQIRSAATQMAKAFSVWMVDSGMNFREANVGHLARDI